MVGGKALRRAQGNGHDDVVKLLRERGGGKDALLRRMVGFRV